MVQIFYDFGKFNFAGFVSQCFLWLFSFFGFYRQEFWILSRKAWTSGKVYMQEGYHVRPILVKKPPILPTTP